MSDYQDLILHNLEKLGFVVSQIETDSTNKIMDAYVVPFRFLESDGTFFNNCEAYIPVEEDFKCDLIIGE